MGSLSILGCGFLALQSPFGLCQINGLTSGSSPAFVTLDLDMALLVGDPGAAAAVALEMVIHIRFFANSRIQDVRQAVAPT